MMEQNLPGNGPEEAVEHKPFVAPCRDLDPGVTLQWLSKGWQDFRQVPGLSLSWGFVAVPTSWAVGYAAWLVGRWVMLITVLSGFIFVAPLLAFALYSVSRQLCLGFRPELGKMLGAMRKPFANALVFALVLLVIFLLWARAGAMVHIFFPSDANPGIGDLVTFLGIGSAVGSIFAAMTFAASVFSLPFIANRDVDIVTAVVSSINAVLRNRWTMLLWATIIVFFSTIGFLTGMLGFIIIIPWLAYASWHGYRDALDVAEWPVLPPWGAENPAVEGQVTERKS
jgi:uncharacterized membrane protein